MRRWLEGAYCNTKGVAFCKRTTMGDTKTIHFFDDARCNSPTFNLRLLRRACLGFKQWCFPDGGFQAPQAMARRSTFRSTIYGIWMFPKMGNPMEYVPIYIYICIYIYMVYSGKSHENWGPPKSSICSWVKPMVFSHPNPGCLVQTAILGQRRMLETHGGCLQLPYQHMGLSKD